MQDKEKILITDTKLTESEKAEAMSCGGYDSATSIKELIELVTSGLNEKTLTRPDALKAITGAIIRDYKEMKKQRAELSNIYSLINDAIEAGETPPANNPFLNSIFEYGPDETKKSIVIKEYDKLMSFTIAKDPSEPSKREFRLFDFLEENGASKENGLSYMCTYITGLFTMTNECFLYSGASENEIDAGQKYINAFYSLLMDLFDCKEAESKQLIESVKSVLENFVVEYNLFGDPEEFEEIPRQSTIKPDKFEFPLDNVNSSLWGIGIDGNLDGYEIKAEKDGYKKQLSIYCNINFDELEAAGLIIPKTLNEKDKRVLMAVNAFYLAGNKYITASSVANALSNCENASAKDIASINDSLTKLLFARGSIDNSEEAAEYKQKPRFVKDFPLLPGERVTAEINGNIIDSAIFLYKESPLFTFARERQQITTQNIDLLRLPIRSSDLTEKLNDYLLQMATRAKGGKANKKRLMRTVYERLDIPATGGTSKDIKTRQRIPGYIDEILTSFIKKGLIKDYKWDVGDAAKSDKRRKTHTSFTLYF